MRESRGKVFSAALLLCIAGGISWAVFTLPTDKDIQERTAGNLSMTYGAQTLREEKDGKLVWEISSARSTIFVDTKSGRMEEVKARFYAPNDVVVEIAAPIAVYDEKTKIVQMLEGIHMTTSDGAVLSGDTLTWDTRSGILAIVGKAKLEREEISLTAERLESEEGFQRIRAVGSAHIVERKTR